MSREKIRRIMIFSSSVFTTLLVGLTGFPISILQANATQTSAAISATFKTKCEMCHGPDGAGSEVGKSMNVPDLRSQSVQQLTDAELAQVISDGKNGMPPFKSSLSADQIHALLKHIRSLAKKK
jgi:mono/diheme cytochrome c family protein